MIQKLDNKTLIFLHIPKTAGSWFQKIIKNNIKSGLIEVGVTRGKINYNEFTKMCSNERISCKALTGHLQYGIGKYLLSPPYYITLLREPVSRYLSQIADIRGKEISSIQHILRRNDINQKDLQNIDPNEFIHSTIGRYFGNLQTRYLCNMNIYRQVEYSDLKEAKLNLKHNIGFFYLVEKLNEIEIILNQEFGWENIPHKKVNVSNYENIYYSQEGKEMIKKINKFDIELYDYAKELLFERYRI